MTTDIIEYLLPNSMALKHCNQRQNFNTFVTKNETEIHMNNEVIS